MIGKGELVVVIGDVGSGKSSLLSGLIGDMIYIPDDLMNGSMEDFLTIQGQVLSPSYTFNPKPIKINGSLSFASSNPWIQNKSVRSNILFGQDFDKHRYRDIIKLCQLAEDINTFPAGDMQEIGEKGINLSGG